MPLPKPNLNEDKDAFISRCIEFLVKEKPNWSNEQRAVVCYAQFRKKR